MGCHKTGCVLCAQNCGLEILVENGRDDICLACVDVK